MVRAQAPRRAKLGPSCSQEEHWRLRAAVGERAQEVERRGVGPMQILESEDYRLRPRPRQNPGGHRRQLPPPQLFWREIRGAVRGRADVEERRKQRRISLDRGRPSATSSRGRRGAVRLEHPDRQSVPGPIRRLDAGAYFAGAARRSIQPRYAASPRAANGTPRRAGTCLGRARLRSGRAGPRLRGRAPSDAQQVPMSSSRPTNGVSVRAPPLRPPPLARTMRKSGRLGDALEFVRAFLLGDEEPGHLALHASGDQDRAWLGSSLDPRGDVRRVAEHFAGRVHHDRAALDADAGGKLRRARWRRSWR